MGESRRRQFQICPQNAPRCLFFVGSGLQRGSKVRVRRKSLLWPELTAAKGSLSMNIEVAKFTFFCLFFLKPDLFRFGTSFVRLSYVSSLSHNSGFLTSNTTTSYINISKKVKQILFIFINCYKDVAN